MTYQFYSDGDYRLIRIDETTGEGDHYQPRFDRWKAAPSAAFNVQFTGEFEPISEARSVVVAAIMRTRHLADGSRELRDADGEAERGD